MSKILIADDEPHILKLVAFTLGNHGFEIVTASDGGEAVAVAEAEQPDLILLDVMMPVMTGYEAARAICDNPKTAHIPIVMLSAKSQQREIAEGLTCGASEYICKPFTPKDLVQKVSEILGA